jgi:hypothetical protein
MALPRLFTTALVAGVLAVGIACSTTPGSPTSPSATSPGQSTAIGDVALKATAPTLVAPAHDEAFDSGTRITLQFQAGTGLYVSFAPSHEIVIFNNADGQIVYRTELGPGTGLISHALPEVPTGSFDWQVRAFEGDGAGPWSERYRFTMKAPERIVPTGRRTPDPPPGVRLPAPHRFEVVAAVASQFPHFLFNSCQEHGGTWDFMDLVVDTLRLEDTRWGYGWKRGVVGDPLLDIITYNWSADPDEGTRNIYTIDIIVSHCGSFPVPSWNNTQPGGGPGLTSWTGRGRF